MVAGFYSFNRGSLGARALAATIQPNPSTYRRRLSMLNGKKPRFDKNARLAMQTAAVRRTDASTLEESFERYWSLPKSERQKEYLSTLDAAEYFDIAQRTLQHWADLGYIRVLPIRRRNPVEIASIKAFIVEN